MASLGRLLFVAMINCCIGNSASAQATDVLVELGGIGHDFALDRHRRMIYVSVPSRNEVVKISTTSFEVVDRIIVGSSPRGIDLSMDNSRVFAALFQSGAVAVLDLETNAVEEIVIGDLLDDSRTNDVVEARKGELYVSGNPSSNGFAYIVKVSLDANNTAARVASNRIIRANPVFEVSPDRAHLYIGEGFSPNSLYKLNLLDPAAPIILEDNHGSVSGTGHLEVSPNGERIYLTSGQVLRTGSFIQAGSVASGIHQFGASGNIVYIAVAPNKIRVYDTSTYLEVDSFSLNCQIQSIRMLMVMPGDFGWLLLGDDLVCGRVLPNPGAQDCNENGLADLCDLDCSEQDPITLHNCGASKTCGLDVDCDKDGVPDSCAPDCNRNGTNDACDISSDQSDDCDANGVPDECQPDCNINRVADSCDIAGGTSIDCFNLFGNGIPDECELDCNGDGVVDSCELASGGLDVDCNANQKPDDCDIDEGSSPDCNSNRVPDECEIAGSDCNENAILDSCDIASGVSDDCNQNGLPDECGAELADCNANFVPDECEVALIHGCCDSLFGEGCHDAEIEQCVCAVDPFCCVQKWDRLCADSVEELNCGTCDTITDCDRDGVPDECENDCDQDGLIDHCAISAGFENDCQGDGVPDSCQPDFDRDGLPDNCDQDMDGDGISNDSDPCPTTTPGIEVNADGGPFGDIDGDCMTTLDDYVLFEVCFSISGPFKYPGLSDCVESFSMGDDDVDLADYAVFMRSLESPTP